MTKLPAIVNLMNAGRNPILLIQALQNAMMDANIDADTRAMVLEEATRNVSVDGIISAIYKYIETVIDGSPVLLEAESSLLIEGDNKSE